MVSEILGIDPEPLRRLGTRVLKTLRPNDVVAWFPGGFVVANPEHEPYVVRDDGVEVKMKFMHPLAAPMGMAEGVILTSKAHDPNDFGASS